MTGQGLGGRCSRGRSKDEIEILGVMRSGDQSTGRQLEATELLRLCMCPQRRLWVSIFVVLPHLFPFVLPDHIRVLDLSLPWAADKSLRPLSESILWECVCGGGAQTCGRDIY